MTWHDLGFGLLFAFATVGFAQWLEAIGVIVSRIYDRLR